MIRDYYNEIDKFAAAWLRELIAAGLIPDGDVDERSIEDVRPVELAGYNQCHFFAGIGGWPLALSIAGWPRSLPCWTASCPCGPFSAAGKGKGFADERHLWPAYFHLHGQRRPPVLFGEQVASKAGLAWLDLVQADLEGEDYAIGAQDICSAGLGSPNIRQRLMFAAERMGIAARSRSAQFGWEWYESTGLAEAGSFGSMEHALGAGSQGLTGHGNDWAQRSRTVGSATTASAARSVAKPNGNGSRRAAGSSAQQGADWTNHGVSVRSTEELCSSRPGPTNGVWATPDWLLCRDGKWRPVEAGTFPLASGISARVGRLRGYGNAINPYVAAEVIRAYMDHKGIAPERMAA